MYNVNRRKSVFKKNIVAQVEQGTSAITELIPEIQVNTKEIIEAITVADSNITLSGNQTLNGFTTVDGSIVLVKGQTTATENGVYVANSSNWYRIANNLNDISLFTILDGDLQGYGYSLIDKPIDIGDDDVNFIQLWDNSDNQTSVLNTSIEFTKSQLDLIPSGYVELMAGVSGKSIDIMSATLKIVNSTGNASGGIYLGYENGTDELFFIGESLMDGTGTAYYKLMNNYTTESINYALGDGFGIYQDAAFTFTGTITATLNIAYRLI